jgi:hypothetical protein
MSKHDEDINKDLLISREAYAEVYREILKRYKQLQKDQKTLPSKFVQSEDFENHLLNAADLKHRAIEVWRDALACFDSIKADYDFYSSHMTLYDAESFLKERGFDRITDKLREAYVNANKDMNELTKEVGNIDALSQATERLVRAFESDETNCRRLLERKNKLIGIQ